MKVEDLCKLGRVNCKTGTVIRLDNSDIFVYIGMHKNDLLENLSSYFELEQDIFDSSLFYIVSTNGTRILRLKFYYDFISVLWLSESVSIDNDLCCRYGVSRAYGFRTDRLCNLVKDRQISAYVITRYSKLLEIKEWSS